jgi:hypothetical protein
MIRSAMIDNSPPTARGNKINPENSLWIGARMKEA